MSKKYTDEFKEKVVREYLSGVRHIEILTKYEISRSRLSHWVKQWREYGRFPDGRGKGKHKRKGRPPRTVRRDEMTDEEYISYLEIQLEIKKYMAFYEKRKQK